MSSNKEVNHLQIPLQELSDATNGFSQQNLIARGGFGNVYKGVSEKHGNIAIKKLDPGKGQGDHEFRTEISLLSVYKHENIVSLLGFCDEDGQKILVYKHESNGSLDKHLNNPDLTWIQRLQICLDAARGLQYLHDDVGLQHRILHRDVKSSNILLDENWKAKVSDFGLSRLGPANMQSTFLISNACGTFGYIDPEYMNTGYLTQKSDVYSFGVVLFEVMCGRLTRVTEYKDERQFLINLVKIHWPRKTLDEIICSDIQNQINRASLLTFSSIAYQCLMSGNERPTMKKVVEQLQKALTIQLVSSCIISKGIDLHDDVDARRNVMRSDFFLAENSDAKISDFGLSVVGPANMRSAFRTRKSDIYDFGGVFVPHNEFANDLDNLHWERKTLDEILHDLEGFFINNTSLNERRTMKKVVEELQKALDAQLAPTDFRLDKGQSARLLASSSQSSPSSCSRSWKYDVFISFRGEDTCNTFVDHLYSALIARQIFTYKDNEVLSWGEIISPSLLKAIQESRIAIIVFSQNYASSSSCLEELTFIMKNMDERGQIVVPIFYDVKPSDVRYQTRYYGEALSRHELNNNNNKVESWREALVRAAGLSGWDLQVVANGVESKFFVRICDNISYQLLSLMTHPEASGEPSANTDLIGIKTRMQELKSLLKVGSGGVHMVGICGMWGSGKSTLASSIYDEISHEFEGCCFVKNVRARSRMHGLKTLQEEILSNVLKLKVTLTNIEQGIYMMERRLSQNCVLIVLDDVDHIDHLEMLAGYENWFGDGSRIIFTTRNQDLVNACSSLTHNIKMLNFKEAIELFSRHAFGKSEPAHGFEEVSLNMVSKFGGHPSALISLGSFLNGKDMSEWMSILDRLIGRPVDEILKRFETPDDGLARHIIARFLT